MLDMLRRLLRDSWVIGITAAIAIGYATVRTVTELVNTILRALSDDSASGVFVFDVAGREFGYQGLLTAAITLAVVGALAAWLLARSEHK